MRTTIICTAFLALAAACTQCRAEPCSAITLPKQIQQKLATDFPAWRTVTPDLFNSHDREVLQECCAKECPGVIEGKFTDQEDGYVVNLVRKTGAGTLQQILYFRPVQNAFNIVTVIPSSRTAVVVVIGKLPPGTYRDGYTGESIVSNKDGILVAQVEAGSAGYFWDGTRFRRIDISI